MLDIAAYGVYIAILIYAAVVDRRTLRIPNKLVVAIFLDWLVWHILRDLLPRLLELGDSGQAVGSSAGAATGEAVHESLLTFLGPADASAANGALAAIVFGGGLMLFALAYEAVTRKYSMGGGDIKLMAASALFLGLQRSLIALFISCIAAVLTSFAAAIRNRSKGNVSRETSGHDFGDSIGNGKARENVSRETFSIAPNGVVRFFESLGLLWREEAEGRLYPKANKASVVLDVLRAAIEAAGVEVRTGSRVERVEMPRDADGKFTLYMTDGVLERADAVILACGGSVARDMMPDSFHFAPQRPVLGPIATDTRWVKQLDNIRVKCAVELLRSTGESGPSAYGKDGAAKKGGALSEHACDSSVRRCDSQIVSRETGEVLFRKYGVSGIAVFNLSRLAQPGDAISIDLFPDTSEGRLEESFVQRLHLLKANIGEHLARKDLLRGAVLPQVAHVLLAYAGLDEDAPCSEDDARKIACACKSFQLEYRGIGDAAQCQVHRGGFEPHAEFNPETMQAKRATGLFAVGEALDIDGPCGGYNLHWAFASGVLAGASAVALLAGEPPDSIADADSGPANARWHGECG